MRSSTERSTSQARDSGVSTPIARHKTALARTSLSRPVSQALADGVLAAGFKVLDYGCGQGGDVRRLAAAGFDCAGWDPVHRPGGDRRPSELVNLGYVVNVIERAEERAAALRSAWALASKVLVVSARLKEEAKGTTCAAYEDGGLTRAGTFQKFYDQSELREWINQTLGSSAVAAAPGVFYVFREDSDREDFLSRRFRRRATAPKLRRSDVLFEQHRALLEPLMAFLATRGRLPVSGELPEAPALEEALGGIRSAYRIVARVTGEEQWERVRLERSEDLLVYLGLSRFERRPRMSELPLPLQLDIKAFFSNYTRACEQADELLFALGQPDFISQAMKGSAVGKETPAGIYVHVTALDRLPTLLRMFEGCARAYAGTVEGANLVKLHRGSPQVSYLSYPDFDQDPHPALATSLVVDLQAFRIAPRSYIESKNPPILHRKELFVAADYPGREKFARLTAAEDNASLYSHPDLIGTREAWEALLASLGLTCRGHRLVRRKPLNC